MSCWVVPAVAAEYWGVSLDVVWDRIYSDLVPHKTERGFVFIDVEPWRGESGTAAKSKPPPTYVSAEDAELTDSSGDTLVCVDESFLPSDEILTEAELCEDEELMLDEDGLGELDEEESATFGRLSWREVRHNVSLTRRPPPKAA